MSCIHPLIGFPAGFSENGKMKYIPVKRDEYYGDWLKSKDFLNIKKDMLFNGDYYPPIEIPCGKCIGCRLDYSREWALRCMMELKYYDKASFLTLTYSDSKVPKVYLDEDNQEIPVMSLRKKDLQDFWKRLRRNLDYYDGDKIRYLASGEYGSTTWRPHYHAIVFGYYPDDCKIYKKNDNGCYKTSESLDKIWSYGSCIVADVDFNTCAYVARYTAKKVNGTLGKEFYEKFKIEEPFIVMSRRPGLGWRYFEDHKSILTGDKIYISGPNPVTGNIPRNFIKKVENLDPDLFKEIKDRRTNKANVYERAIVMDAKIPYSKRLADAEANLLARSKGISRNKV